MKQVVISLVACLVLAACQPRELALPTLVSVADVQTQAAARTTPLPALTPTPAVTRPGITLPPTFTPTPPLPTETPAPTRPRPSATPAAPAISGTLYYVVDGRQFIAHDLATDTPRVVRRFEPPTQIRDLMLSPDGTLVAFSAQVTPLLSEIYVMNLRGDFFQQVSCLGFAWARFPAWTPDGQRLTWFAAPAEGQPGSIYQAALASSGPCPDGNAQQMLVRMEVPHFHGMVWDTAGAPLYYTRDDALLSFDPTTQASTTLVPGSGFGPNRFPTLSARGDIAYVVDQRLPSGQIAGNAAVFTAPGADGRRRVFPTRFPPFITAVTWSSDGQQLLGIGRDQLSRWNSLTGAVTTLAQGLQDPLATFSPDGSKIAYTAPDRRGIARWHVLETATGRHSTLAALPPGTLSDPFWLP